VMTRRQFLLRLSMPFAVVLQAPAPEPPTEEPNALHDAMQDMVIAGHTHGFLWLHRRVSRLEWFIPDWDLYDGATGDT
jgi:hypothetical protein